MKKFCFLFVFAPFVIVPAQSALANGGFGEIFGGLIGKTIGKDLGKSAAGAMGVEQALIKVCDQINKQLPIAVDRETRWDTTTPGPGRRFTYNYTFVNIVASDIDVYYFRQSMTKKYEVAFA